MPYLKSYKNANETISYIQIGHRDLLPRSQKKDTVQQIYRIPQIDELNFL